MKLVLINPVVKNQIGLNNNYRSKHPPLSLAILANLTPPNWEVVVIDENYESADKIVEDADLVGITSFTSNITRAYKISAKYRSIGIPVVIGGIHAWARENEVLQHANAVVIKEAESIWATLCKDIEHYFKPIQKIYEGHTPTVFAIPNRKVIRPDYPVDSLATSRGCPENCCFCSVHEFSGKRYRRQPLELIEQDLQAIKSDHIFVIDDNFKGFAEQDSKDAIEICKMMVPYKKNLIIQAPMSICDDLELLDNLGPAGCRLIFIGVETEDKEGLQLIGKRQNIKYGFNFDNIHKAGMGVIGAFIMGFDTDTPQKLRDNFKFMIDCGVDVIQLTIATPLPGTRMFDELKRQNRLLYTNFPQDWDRYNLTELTYLPKGFRSVNEFYDLMVELVEQTLSNENMRMMAKRTAELAKNKTTTAFSYFINCSYRDVILNKAQTWKEISHGII